MGARKHFEIGLRTFRGALGAVGEPSVVEEVVDGLTWRVFNVDC